MTKAPVSLAMELSFENIVQVYGSTRALDGVSLTVGAGELVCLLGQSGCGKTTLLRIASGIELPTSGRVLMGGVEVAGKSFFVPPEKRGIGLMFQDYALFPHLTILDNIAFGLQSLGREEARRNAVAALKRVKLEKYAEDYPHMLSGGEQQRVALARAIAPRPGILLMDEPFSNLDRRLRDSIREDTITILRETGATTIVVTHDPEEAMRIADRIVLMRDGRIVQHGSPEQLYSAPSDVAAARFFCNFNEVEGLAFEGTVETPLGKFAVTDSIPEHARAIVCIRPQAVKLSMEREGLQGQIVSRHFLGECDHVGVTIDETELTLQARILPRSGLNVGDVVGVEFDRHDVLVFPASYP